MADTNFSSSLLIREDNFSSGILKKGSLKRRKTLIRIFALVVMGIYSLITLFPFYVLFVRSFVSTKDSSELHLWIPEAQDVKLDSQIGNLSVFYNLNLEEFKEAMGIPVDTYLPSRDTLREFAQEYNIPEEKIRDYLTGFYTYNGWRTVLTGTLYNTTFWKALSRSILITVVSLVLLITLSIFTGYGLSGLQRRHQMVVYNTYLLQMVIPAMLILLPQYQLLQWINKLFPGFESQGSTTRAVLQIVDLILINIKGTALSVMIFTAAVSSIPKDIEDSAMIDGSTSFQYIRFILLPLLKVPIISVIVIMAPSFYNQFLEAYVYLDPANSTLLPLIHSAVGTFSTNYQFIYSAVLASLLPLVIVYFLFRRLFVEGVLAGAVKG